MVKGYGHEDSSSVYKVHQNLKTSTWNQWLQTPEPNKYVLEAVKSRDPGHAPFEGVSRVTF